MRWTITSDADGFTKPVNKWLDLVKRIARHAGESGFTLAALHNFLPIHIGRFVLPGTVARLWFPQQIEIIEQRHFFGLGENGKPELLGIAIGVADGVGVDPSSAHAPEGDVLEVANDFVALILLQVLIGRHGIARFRPGVDGIENFGLLSKVVAVPLEVLIPVGEFDDDLYFGINGAGWAHHQIARDFVHGLDPEICPALIALGGDVRGRFGVGKEKVVENDFVKMFRGELGDVLHILAVGRIGVDEGDKLAIVGVGVADGASNFDAVIEEKLLNILDDLVVRKHAAAIGLDINFVHVDLAADGGPTGLQPLVVFHL